MLNIILRKVVYVFYNQYQFLLNCAAFVSSTNVLKSDPNKELIREKRYMCFSVLAF